MLTVITVFHVLIALLLIVLVLVQDSNGDGMGTTFGGGNSGSLLGATGAMSFLAKATRIVVVLFAFTAIVLTRMTAADQGSVLDRVSPTAPGPQTTPSLPGSATPGGGASTAPTTATPGTTSPTDGPAAAATEPQSLPAVGQKPAASGATPAPLPKQ